MTPSGADIDITFNPQSLIENFRKVDKARQDMEKGVAGAAERFNQAFDKMNQGMATIIQRSYQSQERWVKSLEKAAAIYGRSGADKYAAEIAFANEKLKGQTALIERATAAIKKKAEVDREAARVEREAVTAALERQSRMAGLSRTTQIQVRREEDLSGLRSAGGSAEEINRRWAAYERLIAVEKEEAEVAREREIQAIQRRGQLVGASNIERLQMERAEMMEKYGNDSRVAASYERQLAVETQKETLALEKEVEALQRRAAASRMSGTQRLIADEAELKKRLGDNKVLVDKTTEAFKQLRESEKSHFNLNGPGGLLFRGVRDIFEGRMRVGLSDIATAATQKFGGGGGLLGGGGEGLAAGAASATAGIGAATIAVGGLTVAFGASMVASYKAAEAVAEYGHSVHELQIITGMSAREAQQFQYVAKITGQDTGQVTQMMRGLTQAIEGTDAKSDKARQTLMKMGVDLRSLRDGSMSTSSLILTVSEALEKQPDMWLRNKEAIELFSRAGIRSLPMIVEYAKTLRETEGMRFASEEQVEQFEQINRELNRAGELWKQFKVQAEAALAKPFTIVLEWMLRPAGASHPGAVGSRTEYGDINDQRAPTGKKGPGGEWIWTTAPEADQFHSVLREQLRAQMEIQRATGGAAPMITPKRAAPSGLDEMERQQAALRAAQDELVRRFQASEGPEFRLKEAEKALGALSYPTVGVSTKADVVEYQAAQHRVEVEKEAVRLFNEEKTARKFINDELARTKEQVHDLLENPFQLPGEAEISKFKQTLAKSPLTQAEQDTAIAAMQKEKQPLIDQQAKEQAAKLDQQMLETRQTIERERFRAQLGGLQEVNVRDLGVGGVTRADVEADITARYEQRLDIAKQVRDLEVKLINERKIDARDTVTLAQQKRDLVKVNADEELAGLTAILEKEREGRELAKRERDEERRHREEMSRIQLADMEESIKHDADLARRRAGLRFRGDNPAAGIAESYRISVELSQRLFDLEVERIALHETGNKKEEAFAMALHKLHRDDEAAREEAQFKLAEMQQQQLDKLKSTIEPLYETLFTNPSKFGSQLLQTMRSAALKPITSGLSEMTSRALYPLIYGETGTGGIAGAMHGIFGGGGANRFEDIRLLPDKSVPVTIVGVHGGTGIGGANRTIDETAGTSINSIGGFQVGGGTTGRGFANRVAQALQGPEPIIRPGSGIGGADGGEISGPGFSAIANLPIRSSIFSQADLTRMAAGIGLDGSYNYSPISGGYSPIGAPGLATLGNLPMDTSGRYSTTDINRMIIGSALGSAGGGGQQGGAQQSAVGKAISGFLSKWVGGSPYGTASIGGAFGQAFGGYKGALTGQMSTSDAVKALSSGPFAGTPAGPIAGALGMQLAMTGIFGSQRGRAGGILEAAGGGFLVAGPIGAAIGGGIGLGEMLAGVEAPRYEAKRLVKQLYQIDINNTTADQIVNIASQSYGGRVSIAVRSPEVRHMLGLYAAGTGQADRYSATSSEAHGASLVESGGRLFQQSTYQYGNAYSYGSNLPVYGGGSSHTLAGPTNIALSLNVGGQDAARFMTGHVVTPEVVQNQYASAMQGSAGRVPQALMMSEPGAIAS